CPFALSRSQSGAGKKKRRVSRDGWGNTLHEMSWNLWLWLFWLSAAFILYTYAGYPLCLVLMRALRRPARGAPGEETPFLSLLLTVRNEEENVGRKLDNLLALDYPADRLEIWVASDGSTDRTNEIVQSYRDPRVRLVEYDGGIGKAEAINRTVPLTR